MAARHGGDKRGNSLNRHNRKLWMLSQPQWEGNGEQARCALRISDSCPGWVTYETMQADRIKPGGSYCRANVQPACQPCNVVKSDHFEG